MSVTKGNTKKSIVIVAVNDLLYKTLTSVPGIQELFRIKYLNSKKKDLKLSLSAHYSEIIIYDSNDSINKDKHITELLNQNCLELISVGDNFESTFKKPFKIANLLIFIIDKINNIYHIKNGVYLDYTSRTIINIANMSAGKVILTEKECELLLYLAQSEFEFKSNKDIILKEIWGHKVSLDTSTLEIHWHRLRIKLKDFDIFL